jgi:hypothetical protein
MYKVFHFFTPLMFLIFPFFFQIIRIFVFPSSCFICVNSCSCSMFLQHLLTASFFTFVASAHSPLYRSFLICLSLNPSLPQKFLSNLFYNFATTAQHLHPHIQFYLSLNSVALSSIRNCFTLILFIF